MFSVFFSVCMSVKGPCMKLFVKIKRSVTCEKAREKVSRKE